MQRFAPLKIWQLGNISRYKSGLEIIEKIQNRRNMHPAFVKLADKRENLEDWFSVAHCSICKDFTDEPYFLHCNDNHTFCGQCLIESLHKQQHSQKKTCPICENSIEEIDLLIFKSHAHVMLSLVEIELPESAEELHQVISNKPRIPLETLKSMIS